MCTALTYKSNNFYFGRTLDLDISYGEHVTVMPRKYPLSMRCVSDINRHYALIGMAAVKENYPLFFEATNEKGLSMAGLNFPGNAFYGDYIDGKDNIAPFELIPYILGNCTCLKDAVKLTERLNIINLPFSDTLPPSPLHWIISDKSGSVTLESTSGGLKVYENPYGVLTNNPTFDYQMMNLNNYMHLHQAPAENRLSPENEFNNYSLGMGALGLPGDFSSMSRFVRGVFITRKSSVKKSEEESVGQFFRMLSIVSIPEGCVLTKDGKNHFTRYSCCCNTDKGVYYYNTYENYRIHSVDMFEKDIESDKLFTS